MSDLENDFEDPGLYQENSDNEWTDTDSEQVTDYPDSDSETVIEIEAIMDPVIVDTLKDGQTIVNEQVAANLEDSVDSTFLRSETKRIYTALVKYGLDYSDEDISMYAFHIANMYVNKIDFPTSLRDILENIVEAVGPEELGYDY